MVDGSDAYGYLAPEQINHKDGMLARHPAVDSYGLGMSLYSAICKPNPSPNQHLHKGWQERVLQAATCRQRAPWVSVANRLARLILILTYDRQSMRWDLARAVLELRRMLEPVRRPGQVHAADMLAEEVAARSSAFTAYEWNPDAQAAVLAEQQAGLSLALAVDDVNHRIELRIAKIRTESNERWRNPRRIAELRRLVGDIPRSGGWSVEASRADNDWILSTAQTDVESVAANMDKTAALITRVEKAIPRM